MTNIEQAILEGEYGLDDYLEHVNKEDFINDVEELKKAYMDKGAIKKAIESLQKLIED